MTNAVTSELYKSLRKCVSWKEQRFAFPVRNAHPLRYANKTGWLSVDLSAAVEMSAWSTPNALQRKETQSLTSGKVTRQVSFRLSI